MREALGRAFASRPQPRPSADAVEAVLARAAEASGVESEPVLEVPAVEGALFAQSLRALDRLPRPRPSATTLDAVRLAAATASAEARPAADRPARAADRAPALPLYRRTSVWGGAALVMAALVAVVVLPFGGVASEEPLAVPEVAEAADAAPVAVEEPEASEPDVPTPSAAPSPPLAASAAASGLAAVVERRPPPPAGAQLASQPTAPPQAAPPAWETPDDVRMLSLRLQELDAEDALAWDDAPAEAFGVPTAPSVQAAPGIQAVREGAPAVPARARLRTDSTTSNR